jgi:DNA-binding SARP family transcriptional activator
MDKNQDGNGNRDNSTLIERQIAYSLNRLATVVNELSRLTRTGPAGSIELVRAEIGARAELTSAGIEAAHQLRMWRAHYDWLASELDAASRSFGQAAQQLGQLVDTALASWEEQFEVVRPSGRIGPAADPGRPGLLRGLLRRGQAQVPLPRTGDGSAAGRTGLVAGLRPAPPVVRLPPVGRAHGPPPRPAGVARPGLALAAGLAGSAETAGLTGSAASAETAGPAAPADADIAARVLGPLELTVAGVRVPRWSSLKARAVFQYLLLHHDRPVRREVLMELEWPNHSHSSARNNLNVALCSLRNTLDWRGLAVPAVLHREGCYLLNPELTCWTDHGEFRTQIRDAQRARQDGRTQQVLSACHSAVQLYRGPLFEDDLDGDWYLPERRNLKDLYLQALEYLAEIYCESDQPALAIEYGQQALNADPCYEAAHRLLMRCFAQQHQQQLVSRQYRLCAAALQDELDVSPTMETVQLFRMLTSAN